MSLKWGVKKFSKLSGYLRDAEPVKNSKGFRMRNELPNIFRLQFEVILGKVWFIGA